MISRLVAKRLIFLSHTWLDIAYFVRVVSQFMHCLLEEHTNVVIRILRSTTRKVLLFSKNNHLHVEDYTNVD